jgi:Ca-activated chloride channel family protein
MMPQPLMHSGSHDVPSSGGRLVSVDGRALPLRSTRLQADCCAGLARVELEQVFTNPHAEPLRVTYQVPLPSDGAVTGYRFRFGDEEVIGRVDTKQAAREQFEEAILDGRTAALLEEERSSLFTQEVGNIPPGAEVVIRITVDQKLAWIRESHGGWEWRFPTVVGPRYLGASGRVPDAAKIAGTFTSDPLPVRVALELTIRDANARPDSPSHALAIAGKTIAFAAEDAALDRDVVVRWSTATATTGVSVDVSRPPVGHAHMHDAFALLTVTPPQGKAAALPRDLIVLLDTSGSMGGQPLDQAKRVITALIDGLQDRDRLELIEFSMRPRRWQSDPVFATRPNKQQAQRWLASLQAGGGTEMKAGLLAAMSGLRAEAQRQVVLVSDGYIGFEAEIVAAILNGLPAGSRLHTVGVGSAVNRSLTQPSARAGRGVEIIIGLDEDPERATQRLLAATEEPLLVDLVVEGDALLELAPARPHDLFAASPALLSARIKPEGGTLIVHARTPEGAWEQRLRVPAIEPGEGSLAVAALYAREAVEDLETRRAIGEHVDAIVERHGIEFQISTRLTSWIAVSQQRTVDPSAPTRSTTMPHALPHGTSIAGFGLREAAQTRGAFTGAVLAAAPMAAAGPANMAAMPPPPAAPKAKGGIVARRARMQGAPEQTRSAPSTPGAPADGRAGGGGVRKEMSPPAEGAAKKREGFEERKTAIMDDTFDRMDELAPEADEEVSELAVISGQWKRMGDRWVIVFAAPFDGYSWNAPTSVEVRLDDGTRHTLSLESGTTASGSIASSALLRLVVTAVGTQTPVEVRLADLVIELQA